MVALCSGPCAAGYACPAGSVVNNVTACGPGQYSRQGDPGCSLCQIGTYGATSGLTASNCSGECLPGYVVAAIGSRVCVCVVSFLLRTCLFCEHGYEHEFPLLPCDFVALWGCVCGFLRYLCPEGSTNATAVTCPAGQYAGLYFTQCQPCAVGTYGTSAASGTCDGVCSGVSRCYILPALVGANRVLSRLCVPTRCLASIVLPMSSLVWFVTDMPWFADGVWTRDCAAGYACPAGSTNGTAHPCVPGQYSTILTRFTSPTCLPCPGGRYGTAALETSASCTGSCDVGMYSTGGAVSCTACPAGTFGNQPSLNTSQCSGPCSAGYTCPSGSTNSTVTPCGVGLYSPAGSAVCVQCPAGKFGAWNCIVCVHDCVVALQPRSIVVDLLVKS